MQAAPPTQSAVVEHSSIAADDKQIARAQTSLRILYIIDCHACSTYMAPIVSVLLTKPTMDDKEIIYLSIPVSVSYTHLTLPTIYSV